MAALKDIYSPAFYNRLADCMMQVLPSFNKKKFIANIHSDAFKQMELKDRMRHTSTVLHDFLPTGFSNEFRVIEQLMMVLRKEQFAVNSLAAMFIPDYIEVYGIDDYKTAVKALELTTQFVSCEFAVRPFILKYGAGMLEQMTAWSLHKSADVRRLSSEGSRPRLPWAMAIPALKKDPSPILPLLENLKNDPSEYVRRSVANSINDIAKDHPDVVLEIAKKWSGISKETDAIIKHASRTLLKQGHPEILKHFGLESGRISLGNFEILTPEVKIGASLGFTFHITNNNDQPQKVRLEYGIYYKRQNNKTNKKVFKISERIFQPGESASIIRQQKFVLITTRNFYAGAHQLSVIVNGEEKAIAAFELID